MLSTGALCVLTAASPSGCNGLSNVSIDDSQLDSASPNVKDATATNPAVTTRDNPRFGGKIVINSPVVTSSPKGKYAEAGTWTSFGGYVSIDEHKTNGTSYPRQLGPLLR